MKILFCTNVFEVVENGPVKFANLLLQINERYPEHELHILTEDIAKPRRFVHKVPMNPTLKSSPLSQFVRMGAYHREAMRVREIFPFDVLVYNNALVGLWSAIRLRACVGMINDYKNISKQKDTYQTGFRALKESTLRLVEKWSVRFYQKIITNSDYLSRAVLDNYPRATGKVFRLYKGIEVPETPVPFEAVISEPVKILFIKTDYELGGLPILLEASAKLTVPVLLTIIGPGKIHRDRIERMAQAAPNVTLRYLQYQPQPVVIKELRNSHIFCVPSYKEALGVANLEAMAHGIPVVSTRVGGIPEVLDQGRCGWLVPPGDASALAAALNECIQVPELRKLKVQNALLQAGKFDIDTMFNNFIQILEN